MILNLITLDTVKFNLGIADTLLDAALTRLIPIVSADVRRILNCQFDKNYPADITTGSDKMTALQGFDLGQIIYNPNLPGDTYITEWDSDTAIYTISENATAEVDYINPTVNISQQSAISKMIYYRYEKQTVSSVNDKNISSKSIGVVSTSYADSEINKKWNYPQILIDDLGYVIAEVG